MCKLARIGKMFWKNLIGFVAVILFVAVTGCGGQKPMTVERVIQKAKSLDGQAIHVRGVAVLQTDPSQAEMLTFGGCAPDSTEGQVAGWLTLYDPSTQNRDNFGSGTGIKIAESSFHCEGNFCKITCSPFKVSPYEMYEFAGTLRVNGDSDFTLENIDLEASSQLVSGEWKPISAGTVEVTFP